MLVLEHSLPQFSPPALDELFPSGFTGFEFEHASNLETSVMYVLRPDLVRTELIADDQAERHPAWDVVPAPPEFIPRSGVLMRPSEASAEAGKRFLEACVSRLVEAITTEFGAR